MIDISKRSTLKKSNRRTLTAKQLKDELRSASKGERIESAALRKYADDLLGCLTMEGVPAQEVADLWVDAMQQWPVRVFYLLGIPVLRVKRRVPLIMVSDH